MESFQMKTSSGQKSKCASLPLIILSVLLLTAVLGTLFSVLWVLNVIKPEKEAAERASDSVQGLGPKVEGILDKAKDWVQTMADKVKESNKNGTKPGAPVFFGEGNGLSFNKIVSIAGQVLQQVNNTINAQNGTNSSNSSTETTQQPTTKIYHLSKRRRRRRRRAAAGDGDGDGDALLHFWARFQERMNGLEKRVKSMGKRIEEGLIHDLEHSGNRGVYEGGYSGDVPRAGSEGEAGMKRGEDTEHRHEDGDGDGKVVTDVSEEVIQKSIDNGIGGRGRGRGRGWGGGEGRGGNGGNRGVGYGVRQFRRQNQRKAETEYIVVLPPSAGRVVVINPWNRPGQRQRWQRRQQLRHPRQRQQRQQLHGSKMAQPCH